MYSGITQGVFPVSFIERKPGLVNYAVTLPPFLLEDLRIGASVNVDGVCQSVYEIDEFDVSFAAMAETLRLTTLDNLYLGRLVSIERSLRYGQEIGGHEIAGHVCGTATVINIISTPNNLTLTLKCPVEWIKYILPKGFIAVDGSSLTVGNMDPRGFFDIHLIPETLRVTNFANKKIGDRVNIELDKNTQIIVNTIERIMAARL